MVSPRIELVETRARHIESKGYIEITTKASQTGQERGRI